MQFADAVDAVGQPDRQQRHRKALLALVTSSRPRARNPSSSSLSDGIIDRKYLTISSGENVSMPAGTGVWVVKTLVAITCWRASSKVSGRSSSMHADALQRQERAVPFVHVEDGRLDAQRRRAPNAADPQDHFLLDAQLGAARRRAWLVMSRSAGAFSWRLVSSR